MHFRPFAVFAACLLLAACGDSRRDVPPWMRPAEKPRDENFNGGPVAMLLRYDTSKDGVLERSELVAGLRAEFDAADTRHSGCLDDQQADAINQKRQDIDKSTATPLIDWNRDGCIDFREFSAAPLSLFDQMDRNGDRKLTREELGKRPDAKPGDDGAAATGTDGENHPAGGRRGRRGDGPPGGGPGSGGPGSGGPGGPPAVPN